MPWIWDAEKNRENKRKHGLSFETAQLVFDDPLALSRIDTSSRHEERWQTVGMVTNVALFVVHTALEEVEGAPEPAGRIISARRATTRERKAYEEGDF